MRRFPDLALTGDEWMPKEAHWSLSGESMTQRLLWADVCSVLAAEKFPAPPPTGLAVCVGGQYVRRLNQDDSYAPVIGNESDVLLWL
jgi:hypothetical protein